MKRILLVILVVSMLVSLVACENITQNDSVILKTPENLKIEDDVAKWSIIDGATGYIISVDGNEYSTSSNFFNLQQLNLPQGKYEVKVKASGNGITLIQSAYSSSVHYSVSSGQNDNIDDPVDVENISMRSKRYVVTKEESENKPQLQYIYTQEHQICYVYYMGEIQSVPLQYDIAKKYDGKSPIELEYSLETISEESMAQSASTCYSHTTSITNEESFEHGFDVGLTIGTPQTAKINFQFTANIKHYWEETKIDTNSDTYSYTNMSETVNTYSKRLGATCKYIIDDKYQADMYYRLTLFSDCDLYVFAVYDSIEKEINVIFSLSPISGTESLEIDQSPTNRFESSETIQNKMVFDVNLLKDTEIFDHKYEYQSRDLGTQKDPYTISTPEQFVEKIKKDNVGIYFVLTNDIDFANFTYGYDTPINELKGTFMGNGYAIKNYKNILVSSTCAGFFKEISSTGKVQDIRFENCEFSEITASGYEVFAGIVCGKNHGTISNVVVNNCKLNDVHLGKIVVDESYRSYVGGICGQAESGSIVEKCGVTNSYIYASARTGYGVADCYVAGIVGRSSTTITNCYSRLNTLTAFAKGSVKIGKNGYTWSYCGGIVGRNFSEGIVTYCLSFGNAIKSDAVEAKNNYSYANNICPENNGTIRECVEQNSLPSTWYGWKMGLAGPEIDYIWKNT